MIRLLFILIVAALIAASTAWLVDNDGVATFVMSGYEVHMSASVVAALFLLLAGVLALLLRFAFFLLGSPAKLGSWASQRRARNFYQSVVRGLIAAASGDAQESSHFARKSERLMSPQPLGLLLKAQAGYLSGDEQREEAAYRAMLDLPETEFLGLRGLFMRAMRHQDEDQALGYAARAYALKPRAWAMDALFNLRVARREWREAQTLVIQATRARTLTAEVARRRRAVLLAAQAVEADHVGDAAAPAHALEALALAPSLTAAALIAARHLTAQGRTWKAKDIIEAAWTQAPHRDLAEAYAAIEPNEDREARANRLLGLAKLNPGHRDSKVLVAEELIALRRWNEARATLAPLAEDFSSARVCHLMAAIAQGEDDPTTAQLWRQRAARAGHVTDWRCVTCGWASPEWEPVCSHCGAFDTLNWTAPQALLLEQARKASTLVPIISPSETGAVAGREPKAEGDSSRFLRAPDDPGPGGAGMFEASEASETPAETATSQNP